MGWGVLQLFCPVGGALPHGVDNPSLHLIKAPQTGDDFMPLFVSSWTCRKFP